MRYSLITFYTLTTLVGFIVIFSQTHVGWSWQVVCGLEMMILGLVGAVREGDSV